MPHVTIPAKCCFCFFFSHIFLYKYYHYNNIATIDDGRHGEDNPVPVIDNRVDWFVPDDGQVVAKVAVLLQRRFERGKRICTRLNY